MSFVFMEIVTLHYIHIQQVVVMCVDDSGHHKPSLE